MRLRQRPQPRPSLRRQLSRRGGRGQWTDTKLACHVTCTCPTATLFMQSRASCAVLWVPCGRTRLRAHYHYHHRHMPHSRIGRVATHHRTVQLNPPPMIDGCPRLWEEGIPAQGIRPFKDLTPADWSTTPPVGKPKAYTPAHKFANWQVVLRNHLERFVTATKPKLAANLSKVEQYLRFAGECRTQKLTGKKHPAAAQQTTH